MQVPITVGMAVAYQETLLDEAGVDQPLQHARLVRPRLRDRFCLRVGEWLISSGVWLRTRVRPAVSSPPDAYGAAAG
jgi:hypothetical protein